MFCAVVYFVARTFESQKIELAYVSGKSKMKLKTVLSIRKLELPAAMIYSGLIEDFEGLFNKVTQTLEEMN